MGSVTRYWVWSEIQKEGSWVSLWFYLIQEEPYKYGVNAEDFLDFPRLFKLTIHYIKPIKERS